MNDSLNWFNDLAHINLRVQLNSRLPNNLIGQVNELIGRHNETNRHGSLHICLQTNIDLGAVYGYDRSISVFKF